MLFLILADAVLLFHLGFLLFVSVGGLLVLWRPRLAWVHLPLAVWGAYVEFSGTICPLTPLENYLRRRGGGEGYAGGFIDHYITRLLYPAGLTRGTQIILGAAVLLVNVVIYWRLWRRRRDTRISSGARA